MDEKAGDWRLQIETNMVRNGYIFRMEKNINMGPNFYCKGYNIT